ncbi:MAG: sulfite exporter TauE/SafE family protein [Steroidobacteraceae bacterium]
MIAALAGALAIGLSLGLLGSGGSILTVPVLHYLLGQPEKAAIGGSLLVVGIVAAAGTIPYALRRQVDWVNAARFGLPGMAGAWTGATLARFVPGPVQLGVFALVMLAAAGRMLAGPAAPASAAPRRDAVIAGGAAVGLLSGLVGVGGGFLIVPALVLLAGVPMSAAVGTSLAVIALNSAAGFARSLGVLEAAGQPLDLGVLGTIAVVGIAGSWLGQRLGRRLPQPALRRIFGGFLVAMGIFVAVDVAPRLLG